MVWTFKQISFSEVLNLFENKNHFVVLLFLCVSATIVGLHSYRWKLIINAAGHKVGFFKIYSYKVAGMGISFLTPGPKVGGEGIQALLLKKQKIEFHKGLSTVITDKIVDLSVQGVLFVIATIIAITTMTMPKDMTYLLILVASIFSLAIIYVYYQIFNDNSMFLRLFKFLKLDKLKNFKNTEKKIVEFEKVMVDFHKKHNKVFYVSILITVVSWLLMFLEYKCVTILIGLPNVTFMQLFMIITMMGAAYLIPIPMALGVFEAGEITMFKLLNLNAVAGVGLAMFIRARDILWTIISIPILLYNGIGLKKLKDKKTNLH